MDRSIAVVAVLAVLATANSAGCGGAKDNSVGSAVPCDDAAFRAQDEELYVAQATISNAIGGGGDPATLQLDLRRGRDALAGYLAAHPPCDDALEEVAKREEAAVAAIDEALTAVEDGSDPAVPLLRAGSILEVAQRDLAQER